MLVKHRRRSSYPAQLEETLTATSGYGSASASITITGTGTGTGRQTETVLEVSSIEIYGGDDQDGEINQVLDEDLEVQVVDRNDNGVSFEVVPFPGR